MGFITSRHFKAAMLSDTYKVQKYSRDLSEFYKSKKAWKDEKEHKITSPSESSNDSDESDTRKRTSLSDFLKNKPSINPQLENHA